MARQTQAVRTRVRVVVIVVVVAAAPAAAFDVVCYCTTDSLCYEPRVLQLQVPLCAQPFQRRGDGGNRGLCRALRCHVAFLACFVDHVRQLLLTKHVRTCTEIRSDGSYAK